MGNNVECNDDVGCKMYIFMLNVYAKRNLVEKNKVAFCVESF